MRRRRRREKLCLNCGEPTRRAFFCSIECTLAFRGKTKAMLRALPPRVSVKRGK